LKNQDGSKKVDLCSCNVIHNDIVQKVKESLPNEETMFDLSEFFKVFSDSTRVNYHPPIEVETS
jgi:hypothetical protein